MHTLQSRKDGFRLQLPDNFLVSEIKEKYSLILMKNKHFVTKPIDFLNETIQKVEVFGFNNASFEQPQQTVGNPIRNFERIKQNAMPMGGSSVQYRNAISPLALIDKTLNIEFRHTLGYINYMMVLENFMYLYARDTRSDKMFDRIDISLFNQIGEIYAKIQLFEPVINGMDMLSFDYSQPVAQSGTFKVEFKFSNFNYEFISQQLETSNVILNGDGQESNDENRELPEDVYK